MSEQVSHTSNSRNPLKGLFNYQWMVGIFLSFISDRVDSLVYRQWASGRQNHP